MTFLKLLSVAAVVMLASLAVLGCEPHNGEFDDNAEITCGNFDSFFAACDPACGATIDCEFEYEGLEDVGEQLTLDDCSDCLVANEDLCLDCEVGGISCFSLLSIDLGVSCAF